MMENLLIFTNIVPPIYSILLDKNEWATIGQIFSMAVNLSYRDNTTGCNSLIVGVTEIHITLLYEFIQFLTHLKLFNISCIVLGTINRFR